LGLAGSIQKNCFEYLDAAIEVLGSENTPAIPLNENLEAAYLPNSDKVIDIISKLLEY
jgi:2-oxoisovalerate dehydrogenase E1 component